MKTPIVIDEAISHFAMGITHNIFSEPVASYTKLVIEALEQMKEQNKPLKRSREEIVLLCFDELKTIIYTTDLYRRTQNHLFETMMKDGRIMYDKLCCKPPKGE